MVLSSTHVSKNHAEIYTDGLTLRVRDMGSPNGTYLNRQLVADAPLHEGDLLRFGDCDFRVVRTPSRARRRLTPCRCGGTSSRLLVREMIDKGAVTAALQPIVRLPGREPAAFEALGRGLYPGLPENPVELFDVAGGWAPRPRPSSARLFRRRRSS